MFDPGQHVEKHVSYCKREGFPHAVVVTIPDGVGNDLRAWCNDRVGPEGYRSWTYIEIPSIYGFIDPLAAFDFKLRFG